MPDWLSMMLRVACCVPIQGTQHATRSTQPIQLIDSLGIQTSGGGRVNTAANRMTPQPRGNGDRRILDIETAFFIDWVLAGEVRRQLGETDEL
jgi:hypothetical protein